MLSPRLIAAFTVTSACLLFYACAPAQPEPTRAEGARLACPALQSDVYYYHSGAIVPGDPYSDRVYRDDFSRYLREAGALSLSCGAAADEVYRFLWRPAYRAAFLFTARRADSTWSLTAVEYEHPRTREPWRVTRRFERTVSDVGPLLTRLKEARFWTISAFKDSGADDGAVWVLEGRVNRGYRVVTRPNPQERAFTDAGKEFFRLAAIPVPPEAND